MVKAIGFPIYPKDRVDRIFFGFWLPGFWPEDLAVSLALTKIGKTEGRSNWKGKFWSSVWGMLTLRCPLDV